MKARRVIGAVTSLLLTGALLLGGSIGAVAADGDGTCGVVPYRNETGWIPAASVQNIIDTATQVPVSAGVGASAYVTRDGDWARLYIVADVPYDEAGPERQWAVPLDALLGTPEFRASGITELHSGYGFTPNGYPGYSVEVDGQSLLLSSTVGLGFQLSSDMATATITARPVAAECPEPEPEEPVVTPEPTEPPVTPEPEEPSVEPEPTTEEPPVVVVEEPTPAQEPRPEPVPVERPVAPRAVPEAVKTGVGPEIVSTSVADVLATHASHSKASDQWDLTIRELLALLHPAAQPAALALTLSEPRSMPFSNVLEPTSFDELWVIDDAANGYTADGPRYFLAHTHTQGGAVGNEVNEAGLTPGTVIEIAGVRYDVSAVFTIAKPDIGTLPIWQSDDPDEAFLVVCLWNNGSLATHNLVIELHAEGNSGR